MANNYRPFIPTRAKNGGPMTYAIVQDDGTETTVTKAELIASFDDRHPVYVNAEAGIAVRLPLTDEAETIADENRRFVEAEAKHEQRWAARTVELDRPTASGTSIEPAADFDLEAIIEDAERLEILLTALAELTSEEKLLLRGTYVDDQTERELAQLLGLAQGASVNKRKQRVLEKLHSFMASKGHL